MSIKPSHSLLAAMALIAAPAFAQDATAPEADAPANDSTVQLPADAEKVVEEAGDAAAEAEAAAKEAVDAATGTGAAPADEDAEAETSESTDSEATDTTPDTADSETTAAEEAAPGEDATPTEEPAEADADDAAPAAEEAGEPKVGSYYAKSTHQDWTIRCIKADQGTDPCELYQLLKDSEGNSVAEMTLIPLSNGDVAAGATMVVPLETDLTRGLSLSVDGGEARGYPFSFCAPVGCVSRMGFTNAELSGLKRGSKAGISLLPFGADPEKPVDLKLSLAGFTAAFDELSTLAAEARAAAEAQAQSGEAEAATEEEAPAE